MTRGQQFTIRLRLTLWYAAVFLVTGAALLTMMYLLVSRELVVASATLTDRINAEVVAGPGTGPAVDPSGSPSDGPSVTMLRHT